jgi:hypothetical protein
VLAWGKHASVKQVKRVCVVIDEVDAIGNGSQTKQCACSRRWPSGTVDKFGRNLLAGYWIRLDNVSITSVSRHKVMIRRERHAERVIESSAL